MMLFVVLQAVQTLLAADAAQPPRLQNPTAIRATDYPQEAVRFDEHGIVSVLLRVSAEGKVTSCDVTESSGFRTLDATTCALAKSRFRFDPAKDADGRAIVGDYRSASSFQIDDLHPDSLSGRIELEVSKVPSDYRAPLQAKLVFDSSGRLVACEVTVSSGSVSADRAACAYTKQRVIKNPPKSNSSNVPAAAVRFLTISLSDKSVAIPSVK